MSNDNSALIAAIDNAMSAIDIAIQDQETRKVSMKGINGRHKEGQRASKR